MQGIFTLFLIVFLPMLNSCSDSGRDKTDEKILRPVKTTLISTSGVFIGKEFPGVVDAAHTAELGFQVGGKLQHIFVKESEEVMEDQVLAQLDQTDFRLRLESSQADFQRAEADFMRAEKLIDEGYISRSDYDGLKAKYTTASAQLAAARQELEYTTLKAPFSGYIAERHVENFENVKAQQIIVTLQDISTLAIKIDVPESIMIRIDRENKNRRVYAMFEALGNERIPLTLKEASTRANPQTQTFQVTFTMPAPEGRLILPGMTATVVGGRTDPGSIPVFLSPQAVLEDASGRFVYVAVPETDGAALISRRGVETGKLLEQGLEIVSGLKDGDHVVTAGMSKIQDGMRVRLMPGSD